MSRLVVFHSLERHHVVGLLWKTERSKTSGKSSKETVSYSIRKKCINIWKKAINPSNEPSDSLP